MKAVIAILGLTLVASAFAGVRRTPAQDVILRALRRNNAGAAPTRGNQPDRIIGGDLAELGDFPWQGSMRTPFYTHLCGASILTEKFVVTAAHCTEAANDDASSITLRVGIIDLNGNGQDHQVARVYKHEDYDNWNIVNDVSILELATPIEFNENVQPITIGVGRTPSPNELDCVTSGWGAISSSVYPNDLYYLDVNYYNDAQCSAEWNNWGFGFDDDSYVCAGLDNGNSVCFGDSGGPLVCRSVEDGQQYLYGATSFIAGSPCGDPAYPPAVWTDLVNFADWIENITGPLPKAGAL